MKKLSLLLVIVFFGFESAVAQTSLENLKKHVYTIADDSYMGRIAGSEGGAKAADYIANEFAEMGVRSYIDSSYFQTFNFSRFNLTCRNVIAIIDGYDPDLQNEYIIVGAHYDHIGWRKTNDKVVVYNGADDNASGVAAILELARNLRDTPTARSVIFMAFDAEEQGLIGSKYFVDSKLIPKDQIKMMFSVDMVGGLKYGNILEYCGTTYLNGADDIFDVPNPDELPVKITPKSNNPFIGTDSDSFIKVGIPGIYVNTGLKTPYHKPEDDPEIIDYEGLEKVTNHLTSIIIKAAGEVPVETVKNFEKVSGQKPKITFGTTLGLGSAWLRHTSGPVTGKGDFAGNIGFYTHIPIYKILGFQPEVKFERRYAKELGGTFYSDAISVPMNLTLTFGDTNAAIVLQGGVYYNHLLRGRVSGEDIVFDENNYRRNEWGWTVGAGLNFGRYSLRIIGNSAFNDVLSKEKEIKKIYGSAFVSLGYRF